MTRGRPPTIAIKDALWCARMRGNVVELPESVRLPVDFFIIAMKMTIFVKVKRVRARIDGGEDAAIQFRPVIRRLRLFPQSPAALVELWVLSSCRTWQFFRILPEGILEIRPDGSTGT
ncbi:MAG: hypothetical protein Q7T80_15250 [Methanoregula sp.]|nr:hypothetical protein [Methanoregula sp.]